MRHFKKSEKTIKQKRNQQRENVKTLQKYHEFFWRKLNFLRIVQAKGRALVLKTLLLTTYYMLASMAMGQTVTEIYLVDADTEQDIEFIDEGDRINISAYAEEHLTIRVVVSGSPSSLDFTLKSTTGLLNIDYERTDRDYPYSLCGDQEGGGTHESPAYRYSACYSDLGHNAEYTVTVTPYDGGIAGPTFSRTFRLTGSGIKQKDPNSGGSPPRSSTPGRIERDGKIFEVPTEVCARGELRKPRLTEDGFVYDPCPAEDGEGCLAVCVAWKTMLCTKDAYYCIDP